MSLFERIKNIRYDLQEKKKFPGDESGAYKQAKDDLEARKGFSKNKPGGLKADEKNPYVKRSVRKTRVDKLGGDIYDAPKFSQKGFEKSLKDTQKITDKAFKSDVKTFKKIGLKPPKRGDFTSKSRPGGKLVIPDPFGKGDTPGQIRVKGLERKAFKKTQPKDIKLPKSFTDFQKNLQDYKDKDKATMRTGKSSSKVKVSGANNLTRQDVGMAPPDKPKVVKQSEVSKKAKAFTNQIAQQKKAKTDKVVDLATKKQQSKLSKAAKDITQQRDDAIVKREKLRSVKGVKDTKAIRSTNRQVKELDKLAKQTQKAASGVGNPNAPVKYNKMTAGADFIKKNRKGPELPNFIKNKTNTKLVTKPATKKSVSFKIPGGEAIGEPKLPKFSTGITKSGNISFAKDPTKLGGMKLNKTTQAIVKRETSRALRRPENVKFAVAAAKRKGFARGATRFIGKLGPKGRLAATVLGAGSYLATKPGVRNFVRNDAIGTGLAGVLGFAGKKEKVLKKGDGLKTVGKVNVRYGLTGTSKKGQGGKVYDPKQMAQLGKVQKNFIDKYNQKASRNPFQKQIQYKAKGDGTYKILDPKKK